MNTPQPLLLFSPPASQANTVQKSRVLPGKQQPALAFATPMLTTWGTQQQCYILQQTYKAESIELALVKMKVPDNSLLTIQCDTPFAALLYALDGHHFLYLEPQGALPLFTPTYTLQYISAGKHRLLLSPGSCTLLYVAADRLLQHLQDRHGLAALSSYTTATKKPAVLRLPIDGAVLELLQQLMKLPPLPDPFSVPSIASRLLLHVLKQQQDAFNNKQDMPARIMAFIADHIQLPVPVLMQQLQQQFNISRGEADQYLRRLNL